MMMVKGMMKKVIKRGQVRHPLNRHAMVDARSSLTSSKYALRSRIATLGRRQARRLPSGTWPTA